MKSRTRDEEETPLYNTAVRSLLNPRPVMVRVRVPMDNNLTYHNDKLEENNNNNNNNIIIGSGRRLSSVPLTSPVPYSPILYQTEENTCGGERGNNNNNNNNNISVSTPQISSLRRSMGTLLVSPRPSPPSKKISVKKQQKQQQYGELKHLPHTESLKFYEPQRNNNNNNNNNIRGIEKERINIEEFLSIVPPRRRVTSPLHHLLVYENDLNGDKLYQYQQQQQRIENTTNSYSGKGSFTTAATSPSAKLMQNISSSPVNDVDMKMNNINRTSQYNSEEERMSPTSLRFSLPRDEDSTSSSISSSISKNDRIRNLPIHFIRRQTPSHKYNIVNSMIRDNEGWNTSEEEEEEEETKTNTNYNYGNEEIRRDHLNLRSNSTVSVKHLPTSSSEDWRLKTSYTSHNSSNKIIKTNKHSLSSRLIIPEKEEIMQEFHELQIHKEALVLLEYEEKDRRDIINLYLTGIRKILVNHIFGRSILIMKEKTISSSSFSSGGVRANSAPLQRVHIDDNNNNNNEYTRGNSMYLKRAPLSHSPDSIILQSNSSKISPYRAVTFVNNDRRETNSLPLHTNKYINSQKQYIKEHNPQKYNSIREKKTEIRKKTNDSSRFEIMDCMDDLQSIMKCFEVKLLNLLSEELSHRKNLMEIESKKFRFLLSYHRIIEAALQPIHIYLQEASHWQSIVVEASNNFNRLQEGKIDFELKQNIQNARDLSKKFSKLLDEENHNRFLILEQTEIYERQQLSRLFHLGLNALVELQTCQKRTQERQIKEKIESILITEKKEREENIIIEEIKYRSILYREIEKIFNNLRYIYTNDSPVSLKSGKRVNTGVTAIELSAIMGDNENNSYITETAIKIPTYSDKLMTNTTTVSTIQSLNTSAGQNINISDENNNHVQNENVSVERIFFEWNPTSNTLPLTTTTNNNNTTQETLTTFTTNSTGKTVIGVGGNPSLLHKKLGGELEILQTPSPLPHFTQSNSNNNNYYYNTTTTTGTTALLSGGSPHPYNISALDKANIVKELHFQSNTDSLPLTPHIKNENNKKEIIDKNISSTKFALSETPQECSHRDIGVSADLRLNSTLQENLMGSSILFNRHIVPCSSKDHQINKDKKNAFTPLPKSDSKRQLPQTVSRGTQLTPAPKRPYRDRVIFDKAPKRNYVKDNENKIEKSDISDSDTVNSSSKCSLLSFTKGKNNFYKGGGKNKKYKEEEEEEEKKESNDDNFESVEEIDDINAWSHTVIEENEEDFISDKELEEEKENKAEEEQFEYFSSPNSIISNQSKKLFKKSTEKFIKKQRCSTSSSKNNVRRDADNIPDFSLSTMLEATAAGSSDGGKIKRKSKGRQESSNILKEENNVKLNSSLISHSVSESTGSTKSLKNNYSSNKYKSYTESPHENTHRVSILAERQESKEPLYNNNNNNNSNSSNSNSFYYLPLNYMRPTMSWRRHHEELEWQPLLSPKHLGTRYNIGDSMIRSVSRKRWMEKNNSNSSHYTTRFPLEEGPGVWGDFELQRRPFGFDHSGNKAYEAYNNNNNNDNNNKIAQCQSPITRTIYSPRRRRDAALRFMANGSVKRSTSLNRKHSPSRPTCSSSFSPPASTPKTAANINNNNNNNNNNNTNIEDDMMSDPAMLEALHGIIERRSISPPQATSPTTTTTINNNNNKSPTRGRQRAMTPSYVEAFYKLGPEAAGRRRFLSALQHGPVLLNSSRGHLSSRVTPHRRHFKQENEKSNVKGPKFIGLTSGTSRGVFSNSSWSPQPKQKHWR